MKVNSKQPRANEIASALRTKDKSRKISGPMFNMVWKESFDDSFMVKSDGIALSDMELQQLEMIEIGGTKEEKRKVWDLITEFRDIFRPRYKNHFVKKALTSKNVEN